MAGHKNAVPSYRLWQDDLGNANVTGRTPKIAKR